MKLSSLSSSLKGFKRSGHAVVGIDIGSYSIKLLELAVTNKGVVLKKAGRALVPRGAVEDGLIADHKALAGVLMALLANLQPSIKRTAMSISGYSVIVKKIVVPYDDDKDIAENLDIEAENYVPFELTDVYLDFYKLGSIETEQNGSEIFLVAAKREIVDGYAALLQDTGLSPSIVDIDAFALGNAFERAKGVTDKPVCLVDIGANKTNLNIIRNGAPLLAKDIVMGGSQLTEAIKDATGLKFEEAEKIKISGSKDMGVMGKVSGVVNEICSQWGVEIKKIMEFHQANSAEYDWPERIFLSGGSSLIKGIEKKFSDETGLDAFIFNPFKDVVFDKAIDPEYIFSIAPQMAISFGLALRSA